MSQAITAPLPEPCFQCAGIEFGAEALAEIHFRTDNGGYYPSSELYYAELVEKETEAECWGFYCEECLAAFGKKTGRRTTLLQVTWDQIREQQKKSLEELKKVTRYR